MKLNIQVIMRDQFETVHFAQMFDKFSDLFLGFLQFEFQMGMRLTGNRLIKTFLTNSHRFSDLRINSYTNFLDADSLENVERFKNF